MQGLVKYAGTADFADGVWIGIALDEPQGKHDGSVQGRRYFECAPGHGLFLRPQAVTLVEDEEPAVLYDSRELTVISKSRVLPQQLTANGGSPRIASTAAARGGAPMRDRAWATFPGESGPSGTSTPRVASASGRGTPQRSPRTSPTVRDRLQRNAADHAQAELATSIGRRFEEPSGARTDTPGPPGREREIFAAELADLKTKLRDAEARLQNNGAKSPGPVRPDPRVASLESRLAVSERSLAELRAESERSLVTFREEIADLQSRLQQSTIEESAMREKLAEAQAELAESRRQEPAEAGVSTVELERMQRHHSQELSPRSDEERGEHRPVRTHLSPRDLSAPVDMRSSLRSQGKKSNKSEDGPRRSLTRSVNFAVQSSSSEDSSDEVWDSRGSQRNSLTQEEEAKWVGDVLSSLQSGIHD